MSLTYEEVAALLEAHPFRFAKTMPQWPHWYTLRTEWEEVGTGDKFELVVQFIRDRGYVERFPDPVRGKVFIRLDVGEHKYWTMGSPLHITKLINRATIAGPHIVVAP